MAFCQGNGTTIVLDRVQFSGIVNGSSGNLQAASTFLGE